MSLASVYARKERDVILVVHLCGMVSIFKGRLQIGIEPEASRVHLQDAIMERIRLLPSVEMRVDFLMIGKPTQVIFDAIGE